MAIEEFGESLLSAQRTRLDEQDRQARRAQKKAKQAQYFQVGGALLGSLAQTSAQKKATSFMRTEPIMAARAKYNAGIAQSISHLENNKLAQAHQQGVVGYLREQYIPLLQDQINRNINEKDYTKDGYDKYIYDKATELAKANESKFNEATAAAMRVGKDSTAFDSFIKLNDGIADTPIGAVAQGIAGLFRGKSQQALRADAANNIISSRYIQDVDALNAAQSALTQGFPALEAAQIGQSIEKYKMSDDDYDEVSRKDDTITRHIAGKQYTITGTRVIKENSWGQKRETFEPDEEFADLTKSLTPPPTVTNETVTSMGIDYNVTTKQPMDVFGNPTGKPIITRDAIGPSLKGAAAVDVREVNEIGSQIRMRLQTFKTAASDTPFEDFSEPYGEYVLADTNFTNKDTQPKDLFDARAAEMITQGSKITTATKANTYQNNSKNLGVTISQHVFLNDMARMSDQSFGEDNYDFSKTLMVTGADHSPLEILEALGSIKKSRHATIDKRYMTTLLSNDFVGDQLNALQSDPETLGKYIKAFNAYQDDPAYNHLFRKEIPYAGERASVYDLMLIAQRANQ
jgi:hypothetical protein|tara:strand:+ start:4885 stop:6606 length:1722 start_codon:yes stop_codon:yes gene_type:complete